MPQRENFGGRAAVAPKRTEAEFQYCEAGSPSRRESWDQAPVKTVREFPDSRWSSPAPARQRRKKPKNLPGQEADKEASEDASAAAKRFDCNGGNRKKQKARARLKRSGRQQPSARFAAADADKRRVFVIACALASFDFLFGLFVGHSSMDAIEDLAFRQPGVFESRDFGAGHDRQAIQVALKDELNRGIRKTDQLESNSVYADGIELVGVRDIENLLLRKSGASQIGSGFGAEKDTLVNMRGAHQFHAGVIADSCVLHLYDLRDFHVRDIEPFELLDVAGKHSCLVQRTIVREGMLVAAGRRQNAYAEKES
jgi:hypothetical protein